MSAELNEAIAPWIAEHTEARAAAWQARQERKKAERAERKEARDWGLVQRHGRKLARIKQQPSIT
jgi:hypothetical protein